VNERIHWIREAAGERFDSIELNVTVTVPTSDDREDGAAEIAARWNVPIEHVRESPFALLGDTDAMEATLIERREQFGFSYISVGEAGMQRLAPVVARLAGS
jgi:hypothetical protein